MAQRMAAMLIEHIQKNPLLKQSKYIGRVKQHTGESTK